MDGFALRAARHRRGPAFSPGAAAGGRAGCLRGYRRPAARLGQRGGADREREPLDEAGQPAADPRHPDSIRLRAALPPWTHVRPLGEDIVATQLVLPAGQILRPVDLGAVAACGHTQVVVARRPRVAILPTGTELVPVGQPVKRGDIIEYNSLVLAAQVNGWGGQAMRYPITPDDFDLLCQRVQQAADEQRPGAAQRRLVGGLGGFLGAGGGGTGRAAGARRGRAPGTPGDPGPGSTAPMAARRPIIGVPGYPVSAALTGEIFVEPLLAAGWGGRASSRRRWKPP